MIASPRKLPRIATVPIRGESISRTCVSPLRPVLPVRGGRPEVLIHLALTLGHLHSDLAAFKLKFALAKNFLLRGVVVKRHVSKLFAVRNEDLEHSAVLHHCVLSVQDAERPDSGR